MGWRSTLTYRQIAATGIRRSMLVLATYGDLETGWIEVMSVGAGEGKGLVALPDEGDRVLVLLSHGDWYALTPRPDFTACNRPRMLLLRATIVAFGAALFSQATSRCLLMDSSRLTMR